MTMSFVMMSLVGTMSGGGGKVVKGKMSSRTHDDVSPRQLTEMESTLTRKEKAFEVNTIHVGS